MLRVSEYFADDPTMKTFDEISSRYDTIPACDGQTDRQTP